jgi:4-amino-4-deoxy-L-arabinose transferase-like glycosyltransferase
MNADPYAPPAYRIVTAPFIFWGGRMLAVLRAVSLMVFWLTLFVIYRTGVIAIEGPAGRAAGIVSAMLVGMYFEVGWSIRIYGTEFTLYFATALLLYCLVRGIRVNDWPHLTWIGLGFALGLGLLSKVSFALLAGPPMVVALGLVVTGRMPGLSIWKLLASAAIATVIAGPFYYLHGKVACM